MNMKGSKETSAEKLERMSEYIKTANSFAKYAYKEWVEGQTDERAMLVCFIDRTTPDGTGMMNVVAGDNDLLTAAVMQMMEDDRLSGVFRKARMVNETSDDIYEQIRDTRSWLRKLYAMAALGGFWTLCVIAFQVVGIAHWITTVSNLLLMTYIAFLLGREISHRRTMLRRMKAAVMRDRNDRIEHAKQSLEKLYDFLRRQKEDDDEDDD